MKEDKQDKIFIDDGKDDVIVTGIEPQVGGISHESVLADVPIQDNVDAFDEHEEHRDVTSASARTEEGIGIFEELIDSFKK